MKIKLDENMPVRLADSLKNIDYSVSTVFDEGLAGCNDKRLWIECQKEKRFLVTQDLDFSDTRKFAPGSHFGVMLVRLRNPSRTELLTKVRQAFDGLKNTHIEGSFIVLTDRKLRITHPPKKSL